MLVNIVIVASLAIVAMKLLTTVGVALLILAAIWGFLAFGRIITEALI